MYLKKEKVYFQTLINNQIVKYIDKLYIILNKY